MAKLLTDNPLLLLFLIMALGYALGRIRVSGISLGAAGILIVALVFGHFGYEVPSIVQNIGLAAFVTAVGFIAGPGFFENFKGKVLLTSHTPMVPHKEFIGEYCTPEEYAEHKEIYDKVAMFDRFSFERADYIVFPCREMVLQSYGIPCGT